jgi:hypothetical protein
MVQGKLSEKETALLSKSLKHTFGDEEDQLENGCDS